MTINGREIKTVAVDFDGTLFVEEYPYIGEPIIPIINYVKSLKEQGVELVLYTAREGKLLEDAISACKEYGIEFDAVNENLQWRVDKYGPCRKIAADLYIDDRAVNPQTLSEYLKYRIVSSEEMRREYSRNPYIRETIKAINDHDGDFLPALYVLAEKLYNMETTFILLKDPVVDAIH